MFLFFWKQVSFIVSLNRHQINTTMSAPANPIRSLEGISAQGLQLLAEFSDGTTELHDFPDKSLTWGCIYDWNEQDGTVTIEDGENEMEMTMEELLDSVDIHEVEFYLGYVSRFCFEYIDHDLNANEWLSTTRKKNIYATDQAAAYREFHRIFKNCGGVTNVNCLSRAYVLSRQKYLKAA